MIHRLKSKDTLRTIQAHTSSIASIDFAPAKVFATASTDGRLSVWQVLSGGDVQKQWELRFLHRPPISVRFSPDGGRLGVLLRDDHCVRVIDLIQLDAGMQAIFAEPLADHSAN